MVRPIVDLFAKARRPLVVTSYLGRNPDAVAELMRFCDALGVGILESVPNAMNVPHDSPLYLGNQWNEPHQNPCLAAADAILVLDCDVPWIPTVNRPSREAEIVHIDVDPLKAQMPLWYIGARHSFAADAATALRQLNEAVGELALDDTRVAERRAHYAAISEERRRGLRHREARSDGAITPEFLVASVRAHVDADTIILNEGITNYHTVFNHLAMTRPGSIFTSGGGSLGWNGGAAIGAKLAAPGKDVFALTGDGSYMFSVPSSVHWMSRRYEAPFLQVIFNNGGWRAPRFSALAVHPDGYASRAEDIGVSFAPSPDYGAIATASGDAFARKVEAPADLEPAIAEAVRVLREERRSAVLDVVVQP